MVLGVWEAALVCLLDPTDNGSDFGEELNRVKSSQSKVDLTDTVLTGLATEA